MSFPPGDSSHSWQINAEVTNRTAPLRFDGNLFDFLRPRVSGLRVLRKSRPLTILTDKTEPSLCPEMLIFPDDWILGVGYQAPFVIGFAGSAEASQQNERGC